jgi:hypothetical protein
VRHGGVSESEGFGRIPTDGIKALARLKLQNHPAILREIEDLPHYLPMTSANIDKIIIYWDLVTAALEER